MRAKAKEFGGAFLGQPLRDAGFLLKVCDVRLHPSHDVTVGIAVVSGQQCAGRLVSELLAKWFDKSKIGVLEV
ncbi:MAG: hypothetical protein WDO74_10955 [Pseudomonadota bacterium]